jgi:8-oxo-dGTP pyrophosphatase MutT (NUDIX family)
MDSLEGALRRKLASREPKRLERRNLRPAAVLIPLVCLPDEYQLLLTLRSSNLRRQPGDISFPGGAIDSADSTPLAAALRESEEEVGLRAEDVEILGQMDERETITGFRLTPFVGSVAGPYTFSTNHEVAELVRVPLSVLRRPDTLQTEFRRHRGRKVKVYHYLYKGYDIWGITGRLIKEFLELIPPESVTSDP